MTRRGSYVEKGNVIKQCAIKKKSKPKLKGKKGYETFSSSTFMHLRPPVHPPSYFSVHRHSLHHHSHFQDADVRLSSTQRLRTLSLHILHHARVLFRLARLDEGAHRVTRDPWLV